MAKIYFVVTSWALEDAIYQFGREFSPTTTKLAQAEQMFQELVQREKARLMIEQPHWWGGSEDEESSTNEERKWEVWEDGSFDDNHITIELVEAEENKEPFDPNVRWAVFSGVSNKEDENRRRICVCKVNMLTKEVFDFEPVDGSSEFSHEGFKEESISFYNGEKVSVFLKEKAPDKAYWYR